MRRPPSAARHFATRGAIDGAGALAVVCVAAARGAGLSAHAGTAVCLAGLLVAVTCVLLVVLVRFPMGHPRGRWPISESVSAVVAVVFVATIPRDVGELAAIPVGLLAGLAVSQTLLAVVVARRRPRTA